MRPIPQSWRALSLGLLFASSSCAVFYTRPVQEMSDTAAALRAAMEVQADTLAPELMRQAREWYQKARHEYQYKNFREAKESADKSRAYAEQAEYESLKNGGNRVALPPDPLQNTPSQPPPTEN